jgi:hypothetical protein
MNTTTNKGEVPPSNRSEKLPEKSLASLRRDIMKEEDRVSLLESLLDRFLAELQEAIKAAGERIDEMRDEKEF